MAKRSRMSMLKRQREMKRNERAARKRAKRHGLPEPMQPPTPTVALGDLLQQEPPADAEKDATERSSATARDDGPGRST